MNLPTIFLLATGILTTALQADFETGLRAYENGEYTTAIEAFERALEIEETAAARHNLALAQLQNEQLGEAIWNLEQAIALDPGNDTYRFKRDTLREQAGLSPYKPNWRERLTQTIPPNTSAWTLAISLNLALAAALIPAAARRPHTLRARILLTLGLLGTATGTIALTENHRLQTTAFGITPTPTELRAAPASAAPQTGLIRPGEHATVLDHHNNYLKIKTESEATGWLPRDQIQTFLRSPSEPPTS